jgi:hypothetical protein
MTSAEHSRREILLVDPTGLPLDTNTTVVQQIPYTDTLEYSPIVCNLTLCMLSPQYQVVAECTYALVLRFEKIGKIAAPPHWATAVAISDHYLVTTAHAVQWITDERDPIDPKHEKVRPVPMNPWSLILEYMPP